jgi:tRNA pseudouridine38-40 synthase
MGDLNVRMALLLEYDGTNYAGWQRQNNGLAIQQVLEEAIEKLTGERTLTHASGRTDAGVHALGQVVHFDTQSRIPPHKFSLAVNTVLPEDIRVICSVAAKEDFHARFDAMGKTYRYAVCNSASGRAVGRQYCAHVPKALDVEHMQQAAQAFLGAHDFNAFMAQGSPVKSTVRRVYESCVYKQEDMIYFEVAANGFLYNMVRIMAGTLLCVGLGKMRPEHVASLLHGNRREYAGYTAKAKGLTLLRLDYGEKSPFQAGGEGKNSEHTCIDG